MLKVENESFKAQLNFEAEKFKLNMQKDIAERKNEVDLQIATMKLQPVEKAEEEIV